MYPPPCLDRARSAATARIWWIFSGRLLASYRLVWYLCQSSWVIDTCMLVHHSSTYRQRALQPPRLSPLCPAVPYTRLSSFLDNPSSSFLLHQVFCIASCPSHHRCFNFFSWSVNFGPSCLVTHAIDKPSFASWLGCARLKKKKVLVA